MDGEGGETGACGHGPAQGKPMGEPRDNTGEEGISGAGGIHHFHPVGGAVPGIAGDAIVVDAARGAEGDHHAAQAHAAAVVQDGLYGGFGIGTGNGVVQQPFGLDIIADEAAGVPQQVRPALHHAHIGGDAVEILPILLAQCYDPFAKFFAHIHLQADAIRPGDNLLAPFLEVAGQRLGIRHLAGAAGQVALFIHHGQPQANAVLRDADAVPQVDLLRFQPLHRLPAHGGGIPQGDEGDRAADAGHVLGYIAGHTAVDKADAAQIGAGGVVLPERKALDIDKDDAHNDSAWHSGIPPWQVVGWMERRRDAGRCTVRRHPAGVSAQMVSLKDELVGV